MNTGMKRKFTTLVVTLALMASAVIPGFAGARLERPVIEEIDAGKNSIKIDWTYVQHSDGYEVYRATSKDGRYKQIDTSDESWYRDYDIEKGKKYYYKVKAFSYGDYEDSKLSTWRSAKVKKVVKKSNASKSSSSGYGVSETVYLTRTGAKYHRYGCRYLRYSCIASDLSSALSRGYEACLVCW